MGPGTGLRPAWLQASFVPVSHFPPATSTARRTETVAEDGRATAAGIPVGPPFTVDRTMGSADLADQAGRAGASVAPISQTRDMKSGLEDITQVAEP